MPGENVDQTSGLINLLKRYMDPEREEYPGYTAEVNDSHSKIRLLSKIFDTLEATLSHAIALIKPEELDSFCMELNQILTNNETGNNFGLTLAKNKAIDLVNQQKKKLAASPTIANQNLKNNQKETPATSRKEEQSSKAKQNETADSPDKKEEKPQKTPADLLEEAYANLTDKFLRENKDDPLSKISTIFPPGQSDFIKLGLSEKEADDRARRLYDNFMHTCTLLNCSKNSTSIVKSQTALFSNLAHKIYYKTSEHFPIEEILKHIESYDREDENTANALFCIFLAYKTTPNNLYVKTFTTNLYEWLSLVTNRRNERKQEDQEKNNKFLLEKYVETLRAYKSASNDWHVLLPPDTYIIQKQHGVNEEEAIALEFRYWEILIRYCESMRYALSLRDKREREEASVFHFRWFVDAVARYSKKNYTHNDFSAEINLLRNTQHFKLANILEEKLNQLCINADVKKIVQSCYERLLFLKSNINKLENLEKFFTEKRISYFNVDDVCITTLNLMQERPHLSTSINKDLAANNIISVILNSYTESQNKEILGARFINELCDLFEFTDTSIPPEENNKYTLSSLVHSKLLFTSLICEYTHDWSSEGIKKKNAVADAWKKLIEALVESPHNPQECRTLFIKLCTTVAYPANRSIFDAQGPNLTTESMQRIAREGARLSSKYRQLLGLPLNSSADNSEEKFLSEINDLLQEESRSSSNSLGYKA